MTLVGRRADRDAAQAAAGATRRAFGSLPGMREKDRGIWRSYSWRDCLDNVRRFRAGPGGARFQARRQARGGRRQPSAAVLGAARPRRRWAGRPCRSTRTRSPPSSSTCSTTPRSRSSSPRTRSRWTRSCRSRPQLPALRLVVFDDPRGMSGYRDPHAQVLRRGAGARPRARRKRSPGYFERELAAGTRRRRGHDRLHLGHDRPARRARCSVMRNMVATAENFVAAEPVKRGDNWLAYLPMAWVGDVMLLAGRSAGRRRHYQLPGESRDGAARPARAGAAWLLAPPRIWESLLTQLQVKAADASWLKRHVYERFRRAGRAARAAARPTASRCPATTRLDATRSARSVVYGPVRDQIGLRQRAGAYTGGAPLGPDTFRFFRSFGVNLKQVYGATEASALVAFQRDDQADPDTVGRPVPGVELRIADDGEVLVAGPGRVRRLLQAGRGHARGADRRRLAQDGRCRPHRPAGPARHHRPRQGRRQARRRHAVRAAVHREQAEVQPLYPRGRRVRRRSARSSRP